MPQATSSLGIKSSTITLVQSLSIEKKMTETPLFDLNGAFVSGDLRNPVFSFDVSGKGDVPSGIAVGGTLSGGNVLTGISGGKTLVESLDVTEHEGAHNEFKFSGRNWPSAS